MGKLWGDHYWNPTTSKWTTNPTDANGVPLERAFNRFVLDPIFTIVDAALKTQSETLKGMLGKLGVKLPADESQLEGRALAKAALKAFLPAGDALLELIVFHLPSPVTAQRYRAATLYEGPSDDASSRVSLRRPQHICTWSVSADRTCRTRTEMAGNQGLGTQEWS